MIRITRWALVLWLGIGFSSGLEASDKRLRKANAKKFLVIKRDLEADPKRPPHESEPYIEQLAALRFDPAVEYLIEIVKRPKEDPSLKNMVIRHMGGKNLTALGTRFLVSESFDHLESHSHGLIKHCFYEADDPEINSWLAKQGWKTVPTLSPPAQLIVLDIFQDRRDPEFAKGLTKLLGHRKIRTPGQAKLVRILRGLKYEPALKKIARLYRYDDPDVMKEVLLTVRDFKSEEYTSMFIEASDSHFWEVQVIGIDLLGDTKDPKMLERILDKFDSKRVEVQIAAVQAVRKIGGEATMEPLIELLDESQGRLKDDVIDTLIWLTGTDRGTDAAGWRQWWKDNQGKVEIKGISQEEFEELLANPQDSKTGSYYGLRVLSSHVSFVLDLSGSMEEPYFGQRRKKPKPGEKPEGEGEVEPKKEEKPKNNKTKMQVARRELLKIIGSLRTGVFFNILTFDATCSAWQAKLIRQDEKTKEQALAFVGSLKPTKGGTTNIYNSVMLALEDPDVDTIYFLSDGAPTAGEYTETDAILEKVRERNRERKVKIHTIGFKLDPVAEDLMRRLASENYGTFVSL